MNGHVLSVDIILLICMKPPIKLETLNRFNSLSNENSHLIAKMGQWSDWLSLHWFLIGQYHQHKTRVVRLRYGTDVGLAALEWLYIHITDDPLEEWLTNVIALILDKCTSPWLSSCGGRSSVLPMFECMWWQDRCSCRLSSQRLGSCGDRTASSQRWQDKRSGIIEPF